MRSQEPKYRPFREISSGSWVRSLEQTSFFSSPSLSLPHSLSPFLPSFFTPYPPIHIQGVRLSDSLLLPNHHSTIPTLLAIKQKKKRVSEREREKRKLIFKKCASWENIIEYISTQKNIKWTNKGRLNINVNYKCCMHKWIFE